MNLNGIEWEGVDWIHLTRDRNKWQALVNTIVSYGFQNVLEIS
jgi:hypothetical protein